MNEVKNRVEKELSDLQEKNKKLFDFILSDNFRTISKTQQDLLQQQCGVMFEYEHILKQRLLHWEK